MPFPIWWQPEKRTRISTFRTYALIGIPANPDPAECA
jgi:hypothetical protein